MRHAMEPVHTESCMHLLRARMPRRAVIADIAPLDKLRRYGWRMLRALPFQTIGDIGRHGLELHVYCPSCYSTRGENPQAHFR
jgi:hypothetical protein